MDRTILVCLALTQSACTYWKNVPVATTAPRDTVLFGQSGMSGSSEGVRVRLVNGGVMSFRAVAIRPDALYGFIRADSVALNRDSVSRIEVRTVSRRRTAWAGAIGMAAYFAAAAAFSDRNSTY